MPREVGVGSANSKDVLCRVAGDVMDVPTNRPVQIALGKVYLAVGVNVVVRPEQPCRLEAMETRISPETNAVHAVELACVRCMTRQDDVRIGYLDSAPDRFQADVEARVRDAKVAYLIGSGACRVLPAGEVGRPRRGVGATCPGRPIWWINLGGAGE